jgi:ligand-binding sensor domain-containing protein
MKKIIQILAFLFLHYAFAQVNYSSKWEDFFSYTNVKDFVLAQNKIYAIVDNALFMYNTNTGEVSKISSVNGLSGENTTSIHYSKDFNKVIIGYETGLLEIIDSNNNITIAKDIVNFNYSGNKQINDITEFEGKLYLSTSFAIVVYDLKKSQFGDTYFIGNQSSELLIQQIKIFQDTIYAATEKGIFTASVTNPNLIDFNNWTQYNAGNNFLGLEIFNNQIYVASNRTVYTFDTNLLVPLKTYASSVRSLKAAEQNLTISTQRSFYVYDIDNTELLNYTTSATELFYYNLNTALYIDNTLYLGTQEFGILKSNTQNLTNFQEIHPAGPVSNLPFSINVKNNNLWVVYGGYTSSYRPLGRRLGFSHFNGTNWINTPYSAIGLRDLVHITFDPLIDNKVYISSWGGGMFIVEDDIITTYWNHTNSGLENLYPNPSPISIRINGANFDSKGNLWIANAWVEDRVKKHNTDDTWFSFDMSSVITNPAFGLNELVIDKTTNIWIGSRRNGVLVFNENGNQKKSLTTELTKGALPDLNARTVQVDNNNRVWIGTKKGLVVQYNAATIFNESNIDAAPVIILDDGIPKKLLGEQVVNSIAIDGADNKWFGTESGGVLQTNPSGLETLNNFNKNNSPLPSNTILKIAVDKSNGKVFFATDKGIVAFKSNVSSYGDSLPEVYAFPNPSTKSNEFISITGRNGLNLPSGTNIKILDTAGNLVYETNIKEGDGLFGGKVVWNKTNLAGNKVASGIYIVMLITKDNFETAVTKIAIIN